MENLYKKVKDVLIKLKLWNFYTKIRKKYLATTDKHYDASPSLIAAFLRNTIKDKNICDLGCRKGHLMVEFLKYTKNVIGIELEKEFYDICIKKGLNVICGDYYKILLPKADIYYIWAVMI